MDSGVVIAPQGRSTAPADKHRWRPGRRVPERSLTCPHPGCTYTSTNQQGISAHITQAHGQAGKQTFTCEHCSRTFGRKGALTLHLLRCEKAGAVAPVADQVRARTDVECHFQCPDPLCGLSFMSKSQLNRHTAKQCLGRVGSGAVVRNGKYVFVCCGKEFGSTQALGIHKRKVSR
eukprot:Skav203177  [mRNA]  locus=scaffold39:152936:153463:+ [translate_table: standard]